MNKIKLILTTISVAIILCSCGTSGNKTVDDFIAEAEKVVTIMAPEELFNLMNSDTIYTLVDIRQKDEHYYGYIPGSVLIPRGSIEFSINSEKFWEDEGLYMPGTDEIIVLYCKKGKRSLLTAKTMGEMGYKNVFVLKEGWKNWELTYPDYCEKNLEMLSGGGEPHDDGGGC